MDKTKYFAFKNEGKGNNGWPYDKAQYLILNIAIGGAWGGQKGIDETIFPQRMYIDYVRVYQEQRSDRTGTDTSKVSSVKYGLSKGQRRTIFTALIKAVDQLGENAAKKDEWPKIAAEYEIDVGTLAKILDEGLDSGWLLPTMDNYTAKTKSNRLDLLLKHNQEKKR